MTRKKVVHLQYRHNHDRPKYIGTSAILLTFNTIFIFTCLNLWKPNAQIQRANYIYIFLLSETFLCFLLKSFII